MFESNRFETEPQLSKTKLMSKQVPRYRVIITMNCVLSPFFVSIHVFSKTSIISFLNSFSKLYINTVKNVDHAEKMPSPSSVE